MPHQFPHPEQSPLSVGRASEAAAQARAPDIGGTAVSGVQAEGSNVVGWRLVDRSASGVASWKSVHSATGETGSEQQKRVTQNDEYLVDSLLHRPGDSVYNILVDNETFAPWLKGAQERTQDGICELIQAEYEPGLTFGSRDKGVAAMRSSLRRVMQEHPDSYNQYAAAGHKLEYQSTSNPEKVGEKFGDFLHFGTRRDVPEGHTPVPDGRRIFVLTKIWAGGHVAASVIRAARAEDYEPYGKVFDQSTVDQQISMRKDRLLFIADSQEQEAAILNALADIEAQNPELFEDESLILTEPTPIRGVGTADNPPAEDLKLSYNERAEGLLLTAWNEALDTLPETRIPDGTSDTSLWARNYRSNAALKMIAEGKITKAELVAKFRDALRRTAPRFGLSPDNITRNAA